MLHLNFMQMTHLAVSFSFKPVINIPPNNIIFKTFLSQSKEILVSFFIKVHQEDREKAHTRDPVPTLVVRCWASEQWSASVYFLLSERCECCHTVCPWKVLTGLS